MKFHPLFKTKLFVGDNKGTIYLFDTGDRSLQHKKYTIGNFSIEHFSFNSTGKLLGYLDFNSTKDLKTLKILKSFLKQELWLIC